MTDASITTNATLRALDGINRDADTLGAVGQVRPRGSRAARAAWSERGWLTPTEYASATRAHPRAVQRWCSRGWLPTLPREGHDWRIPVETLYALHPSLRPAA